jgi:hypothetical protein
VWLLKRAAAGIINGERKTTGSKSSWTQEAVRPGGYSNPMRYVLAVLLSINLGANADCATMQHSRAQHHVIVHPNRGVITPKIFPVPSWAPPYIPPGENRNLDPSNRGSA